MSPSLNVPNMRVCAMDIGTNSTRYMIADVDCQSRRITVLFQGTQITRLGAGIEDRRLRPENVASTLHAVERFFAHALSLAVSDFRIFGTEILRESLDAKDFCDKVEKLTGFSIEILSGQKEAQLTQAALLHSLDLSDKSFYGVDIGGGSAQVIVHTLKGSSRYLSFPLGAVRLTQRFLTSDPPTSAQITELRNHAAETLSKNQTDLTLDGTIILAGVGGTITTLAAMVQKLKTYDHGKIHGCTVTKSQWQDLLKHLAGLPASQRLALPGLQPGREDIIVAGLAVLDVLAVCLRANEITVSDRGVLYGMLVEYLDEMGE